MNLQFDHRYIKAYYKMAKAGNLFKISAGGGYSILANALLHGKNGHNLRENIKYYFDQMLNYEEALHVARVHQTVNPHLVICGSLALMLRGELSPRLLHDVDFVSTNSDIESYTKDAQLYSIKDNDGYKCLTTIVNYGKSMYLNVFVFDTPDIHFSVIKGLKVQKVGQILKYKKEYNRKKDREDLKNMIK